MYIVILWYPLLVWFYCSIKQRFIASIGTIVISSNRHFSHIFESWYLWVIQWNISRLNLLLNGKWQSLPLEMQRMFLKYFTRINWKTVQSNYFFRTNSNYKLHPDIQRIFLIFFYLYKRNPFPNLVTFIFVIRNSKAILFNYFTCVHWIPVWWK